MKASNKLMQEGNDGDLFGHQPQRKHVLLMFQYWLFVLIVIRRLLLKRSSEGEKRIGKQNLYHTKSKILFDPYTSSFEQKTKICGRLP